MVYLLWLWDSIPACIIILDKSQAAKRIDVMIDASDGFTSKPKNRLREMDVHRVVDAYRQGDDIDGYVRFVPMTELLIKITTSICHVTLTIKAEDIQDIDAHLNGGIPQADIDALDIIGRNFLTLEKCFPLRERGIFLLMLQRTT